MYDVHVGLIAGILLISTALALEIGFRAGLGRKDSATEESKAHVNATQSSLLGILALLLAFTFSLSLQRFDTRSDAVVNEANAIGTAYLRAQLLPPPLRKDVQALLRDYLDLRVQGSSLSMVQDEYASQMTRAAAAQTALWDHARRSAEMEPNPVTTGLFVQSLNELIDSFGRRDAAVSRHVPEVVLLLLYGTFLISCVIIGFACGMGGQRPSLATYSMVALIIALVFVILDLDRPRRGLIEVSQKSLLDLQAAIRAEGAADASPPKGVSR